MRDPENEVVACAENNRFCFNTCHFLFLSKMFYMQWMEALLQGRPLRDGPFLAWWLGWPPLPSWPWWAPWGSGHGKTTTVSFKIV